MAEQNTNSNLKAFYDQSYKAGEAEVFTFFENGKHISEDHPAALALVDWSGRTVLDVGCGTGMLVREVAARGAGRVIGLDYAAPAIVEAQSITHPGNVEFVTADIMNWLPPCSFDVIVTLGTLEHLDEPFVFLKRMTEFLSDDGTIIIACPHFLNLRGYVWMALATLLDVPMSLSDLHFIHPWHMKQWASELGMNAELVSTVDRDWAYGERLLKDYGKRLPNALKDARLSTDKIDDYMGYLKNLIQHLKSENTFSGMDGATAMYRLRRI
jgi:2-polyprenyl-3-methyl-5-hydroxy-6-metoxy-1,4-benzoquinol methylase